MSDSDHGQWQGMRRPSQTAQQGADGTSIELEEAASRIAQDLLKQPERAQEQPAPMLAGRRLWTLVEASRAVARMDGFGIHLHALLTRVQIAAQEGRFTLRDPENGAARTSCWSSAVLSAYLYAEDFNNWLHSAGYSARFRLRAGENDAGKAVSVPDIDATSELASTRQGHRPTPPDGAVEHGASAVSRPALRRRPLMEQNKEAVLNALRTAGHEPMNLEPRPSGKEWKPKADARVTCALTPAAFEHAWKALLKDHLLQEQPSASKP